MGDTEDVIMANSHADEGRLPLSEDESRVLALYDKLQELMLEIAILNAQSKHTGQDSGSHTSATSDEDTVAAQNALLEARARYKLRNDAVEAVMMATPILKAVHHGKQALPVELDLLPYVKERDETTISVAEKVADAGRLREDMTRVQVEAIRVSSENTALTTQLMELTERTKQGSTGHIVDPEAREELETLERDVKASRQRWRVIKGVASGIIAGSGVDWVGDEELRDIVLDPESED